MVLTGSLARNDGTQDAYSDIDIELYVTDPAQFLEHDDWYHQFGEVLVVEALENPGWHPTRLVYYAEGKIDFMIGAVSALTDGVDYDQPFQILLDKDGITGELRRVASVRDQPPTAEEFLQCVHWFYAAAIMWAKYLARDDLWPAKVRDWDSKTELLRMLEWDHKARKGWDYDTKHLGIHIHKWVDPDLLDEVAACWSGYSRQDSVPALWASLSMFDSLSTRTAIALDLTPFDAGPVRKRVGQLLRHTS